MFVFVKRRVRHRGYTIPHIVILSGPDSSVTVRKFYLFLNHAIIEARLPVPLQRNHRGTLELSSEQQLPPCYLMPLASA